MPRNKLADGWDERARNLHHNLTRIFEHACVFVNCLGFRLPLIVRKHSLHALNVPAWWELAALHLFPRCR